MRSRKLAGILMMMSGVTHTSELFVFEWGPIMAIVIGFGVAFFAIGVFLLRPGDRVLWWGAILPAIAIVLGIGNAIRMGSIHPYTIWHLIVDFTVVPICAFHLIARSADRTTPKETNP